MEQNSIGNGQTRSAQSVLSLTEEERRTLLHEHLLQDHDINVPPAGVQLQVAINFFKITSVNLMTSQLVLSVWFRCIWQDSRLSWDPSAWNISDTVMIADTDSLENSLIWTPDIELYNAGQSIKDTLGVKKISVTPDGSVFWSRPRNLEVLCNFKGLSMFPFDTLSCKLEFGAWSLNGHLQDIILRPSDGGLSWNSEGVTVGQSFQDYTIQDIEAIRKVYTYGAYPWPELIYTVSHSRATSFHVWKLIVPQISMAILSFIPYWMSPECGERLGFGITLVLASLTTEVVSMSMMPISGRTLVMDHVNRLSFIFCVISLLESALTIFVFYLEVVTADELLPRWIHRRTFAVRGKQVSVKPSEVAKKQAPVCGPLVQAWSGEADAPAQGDHTETEKQETSHSSQATSHATTPTPTPQPATPEDPHGGHTNRMVRTQFYRQAFYLLDVDFSNSLDRDEINRFGHFVAGEAWEPTMTERFMAAADKDRNGGLNFDEFADFCERMLFEDVSKELAFVQHMVEGFVLSMERQREMARDKWHHRARVIDSFFRFFVPPFFFISVAVAMATHGSDDE